MKGNCISRILIFICLIILMGLLNFSSVYANEQPEPGLLFYLSGDNGLTADYSNGEPEPTFIRGIDIIPDGARGVGFQCAHDQLMAYWAPGNIYAERGTVAFFWRSREPVGKIPFPIFRVGYSDHSSWDMAWLRIDYNGHGFDAFVTDVNLGRARISYKVSVFPKPAQWVHLAFSWDENSGISFYLDGELVAQKDTTAVFYTGLDQFGPHSRIISPYQVQSLYNFQRGGDIDEIRIYDRMLPVEKIALLAKGEPVTDLKPVIRNLEDRTIRDEWWLRYGWNRPDDVPPYLSASSTVVRKVEIHDVYDIKQWFWKGNDGIRETTWPGVYNMSRIIGRWDYFTYPDWNCYSLSGKTVTFTMPEPWNHIEIAGAAFGSASHLKFDMRNQKEIETHIFDRPRGQERTFHHFEKSMPAGKIKFVNIEQETPIGEFYAYNVTTGREPEGITSLSYTLTDTEPDNPCLETLVKYIDGRFMPDERSVMVALPGGAPRTQKKTQIKNALPLVHILIPFEFRVTKPGINYTRFSYTWENLNGGLDGIAIDIPPLDVKPTHGEYFPLNIQVKDPIWPERNMLDFTFSIKPNEAKTLWLDTRDRILPNGYSMYMTIAGAGSDFGPDVLKGTRLRLIFKNRKEAAKEHELDRFTQLKDNYSHLVEEHPNIKKLKIYDRFNRDITDLLRVNPDHIPGIYYWCDNNREQGWPPFEQPKAPDGVPLWAFRQIEDLKILKQFVLWWIDERQIENGELGGGLSDDGDYSNIWPGAALMGIEPEKITDSTLRLMEAYYEQGLFTNGLATIMADELHSYEEGISNIPQTMLLDYGDPKVVERLMETAATYDRITGINKASHRHFRSNYFSGTDIAEEGVWQWSRPYSYLILHPGMVLVEFNGNPKAKKLLLELADGLLAHSKKDANGNYTITSVVNFETDEERPAGLGASVHLLWAAWRWTGDKKYLEPITEKINSGDYSPLRDLLANVIDLTGKRKTWGSKISSLVKPQSGNDLYRHIAWQVNGDKQFLEEYYADQIQSGTQRMYINTEGNLWSDRVNVANTELQRSRLGGVALARTKIYPGHVVSWDFEAPANYESVAILVPKATTRELKIIAYNLESAPVNAIMTAWDIDPGKWEIVHGIDSNGDDIIDGKTKKRTVELERTSNIKFTFKPKATTIIQFKLKSKARDYWKRPDLGIGDDDVKVSVNRITVTIHSLGSVNAPPSTIVLVDENGKQLATASVSALKAPVDLKPKTTDIMFDIPGGTNLKGCKVIIDPDKNLTEITRINNTVVIQ